MRKLVVIAAWMAGVSALAGEITWKGGGTTTAWSDGSNWEGGIAPTLGDTAIIPSGKTAGMSSVDVAYVSATDTKLAGISLPAADATFAVTNTTACTLKVPLSGIGKFLVANGVNALTISGNSKDFTGPVVLSNACIWTSYTTEGPNMRHFGHDNTVTIFANIGSEADSSVTTLLCGGTFANDFRIYGCSGSVLPRYRMIGVYTATTFSGSFYVEGNFSITHYQYGAATLTGKIEHTGTGRLYLDSNGNSKKITVNSGIPVRSHNTDYLASYFLDFGALSGIDVTGGTVDLYDVLTDDSTRIGCYNGGILRFMAENRIPSSVSLEVGASGPTAYTGTFDLNGFDQQCGRIIKINNSDKIVLTSEKPATLTCYGQFEWCGNQPKSSRNMDFSVQGQASFVLNGTNTIKTPTGAVTDHCAGFNGGVSDTSGMLGVKKGTIILNSTTSWPNLSSIEVYDKGYLTINTANINPDFKLVVSNVADKAVTIGTNLVAKSMYADGWLEPGVYGGADAVLDAEHTLKQLSGTGKITVTKFGGKKGTVFIVR